MLKIIVLTSSFPLNSASRSGVFVKKLICHFPQDIGVTVITPDNSGTLIDDKENNYNIIPFRYAPKKYQKLAHGPGGIMTALAEHNWTFLLLPSFLIATFIVSFRQALKADLIYTNWSINGVIGGIIGILTRRPVVTTLRGTDVNKVNNSFVFRLLVHICLKLSSRVITVSQSLKQELCAFFPEFENKIRVIHNGIDDMFFHEGGKRSKKTVRLISVGNLIPGKGINIIFEALQQLAEYDWSLNIVGDGPEQQALQNSCKDKGLEAKVVFCGSLPPDNIPEMLQKADVLVFPSFNEGRSNVVLEAMASGLAIVASNIPSVAELIRDGHEGILFNVGQSDDLCGKLRYLLQHPEEREKMGSEARQAILQGGFSWKMAGQRYAELFKEVTQEN